MFPGRAIPHATALVVTPAWWQQCGEKFLSETHINTQSAAVLTVLAKLLRSLLLDNHTGNRRRTLKNLKNFLHSFSVTSPHKIFLLNHKQTFCS
jgi:hypothetical protein